MVVVHIYKRMLVLVRVCACECVYEWFPLPKARILLCMLGLCDIYRLSGLIDLITNMQNGFKDSSCCLCVQVRKCVRVQVCLYLVSMCVLVRACATYRLGGLIHLITNMLQYDFNSLQCIFLEVDILLGGGRTNQCA